MGSRFLHAKSKDAAQADLSLRWARSHIVGFVIWRLKYADQTGDADQDLEVMHYLIDAFQADCL